MWNIWGIFPSLKHFLPCDLRIFFSPGIFLKSFRVKPSELKEKLYIIHEESGGLTDEQITTLRR